MMGDPKLTENPLAISWHDSAWIPMLSPHNVMDYFSERSNPFYDRTCNNEVLKMQRANPEQLQHMTGTEFCLLHVQEPILYVIRKQQRHSQAQVTPITDYYIIAGTVYQAPDLGSVLNSRLLTTVNHLQSAFEEARSYAKYQPSRGYWWEFEKKKKSLAALEAEKAKEEKLKKQQQSKKKNRKLEQERKAKEEPSSLFQRRRVDMILDLLTKQFPPKVHAPPAAAAAASASAAPSVADNKEAASAADVKSEKGGEGAASVKSERVDGGNASAAAVKREAPQGGGGGPGGKRSKMM